MADPPSVLSLPYLWLVEVAILWALGRPWDGGGKLARVMLCVCICMCVWERESTYPHVPVGEVQTPRSPLGVWPLLPSLASPSKLFLFLAGCSCHTECFLPFVSTFSASPVLAVLSSRAARILWKNSTTIVTK